MTISPKFRQLSLILSLAALFVLPGWTGAQARTKCYANWSQAGPIVNREGLKAARDISQMVKKALSARIVRITLCKSGNGYKYRLVVVGSNGKVRNLTLDARNPVVR